MAEYQPGVRNIGASERRRRRWVGITGFILAAAYVTSVFYAELPSLLLLPVFFLLVPGFLGVLQDLSSFSASYAVREQYDFSGSGGDAGDVRDKSAVPKDRVRATKLVLASLLGSAVVTGAIYAVAEATVAG